MPNYTRFHLRRLALWGCVVLVLAGCSADPDESETSSTSRKPPKVDKPTLVLAGIQQEPTSGTDCALPAESQVVDIFGVPKDDSIQVRIRFPEVWEGTTKEFGVEAERSDIARSSQSATGDHEKVMLTIARGEIVTSPFFLRGSTVDKTRLVLDPVVDDRGTPDKTSDDLHYDEHFVPIIVWDFSVDDIVDYNALGDSEKRCYQDGEASPALQADPGVRASCGAKATSVAADGVSYQLLRLRSGGYGRACFTIIDKQEFPDRTAEQYYGSMSDPLAGNPGQAPATNVETSFEYPQPEMYWALGTYTPPTDFYDSAETERKVKIEVQFMPLDENGLPIRSHITAKNKDLEITIKRPPVLLVHGLWSSSETWGDGFRNPSPTNGRLVDAGFNYPGAGPFSTPRSVADIQNRILELVRDTRSEYKIAVTKIDIIAHSMGGLKARRWIHDDNYRRPENFREGDVRKLVTLTTPHLGSSLANMLINLKERLTSVGATENERAIMRRLETNLRRFAGDINGGAICELADNNLSLRFEAIEVVRSLAIAASHGPTDDWSLLLDLALKVHLSRNPLELLFTAPIKRDHVDPYVFQIANDKLVDIESQSAATGVARDFGKRSHSTVTDAADVAEDIYQRLDAANGWADKMNPIVTSALGAIPRRGGRGQDELGNWIDAYNHDAQCTPGRPMFPAQ